ncbi:MAG: nucleoid-associated protein [Oscillospiraceae bacterium]
MLINIKSVIVDIVNASDVSAILSSVPLSIAGDINDYITAIVEKSYYSDDAKMCEFKSESTFWKQCNSLSWDLVSVSQSVTNSMFTIMRRNHDIPSADLLFGLVEIENADYFYMLKLDYKSAYTHFAESHDNQIAVNIIQNNSFLSAQPLKVSEGFFISINDPYVKVLEKKYSVDGIKDFYISTQILACTENLSPRQKATKLVKAANKIAELYYTNEDNINAYISSTIYEEFQEEAPVRVEHLATKIFKENPVAQNEFYQMLSAENISKEETLSLSEKFQRKFQKQAIKTTSGVEIKIPTQLYSNENEIQFINNPDGTVSLLIKNIKI